MADKKSIVARYIYGFQSIFKGFAFIKDNKLMPYVIVPSLLSVVVLLATIGGIFWLGAYGFTYIETLMQPLGSVLVWIAKIIVWAIAMSLAIVIAILMYRSFSKVLVLPFLGPLLSKTEHILIGQPVEVSLSKDLKNALVGFWVGLRYSVIELIFLVLFIPLGIFQPIAMAFVSSYFLGRSTFDYLLEKHSQSLAERKERVKQFRPEINGLGMGQFILMITIVGIFFAPACSIIGAAMIFYEVDYVAK